MDKSEVNPIDPTLETQLRNLITSKGVTIRKLEISSACAKGNNYMGNIQNISIQGNDVEGKDVSFNWILKSAPVGNAFRESLTVSDLYVREIYTYQRLFPMFEKFQERAGIVGDFATIPRLVTCCAEPNKEALVMEDMRLRGFVLKDRKTPLDFYHVRLVMETYGKLHALSYACKDQNPAEFAEFVGDLEEGFFKGKNLDVVKSIHDYYCGKILGYFDPGRHQREIRCFEKYAESPLKLLLEVMERGARDAYSVIGHGDSWVANMLFNYKDISHPSIPTDICLLDWQLARYNSPALDLSYFIFTCTDKKLRDEHYDDLLKTYYYSTCFHMVKLGSDPNRLFSYKILEEQMEKYSLFGLYMSIMLVYLMSSEAEEVSEWTNASSKDEVQEVMKIETKNEDQYRERVVDMFTDFVRLGYFDVLNKESG